MTRAVPMSASESSSRRAKLWSWVPTWVPTSTPSSARRSYITLAWRVSSFTIWATTSFSSTPGAFMIQGTYP